MKKIFLASTLLFCLIIYAQTGPPATFNGNVFFKYLPPSNTNTTAITIDPSTKQAMSTDVVTGVKGSIETTFRTGQVNITAANIGIGLANASTAGIAKLFNSTGNNTDGSMTQLAITNALTNAGINYVKKTGETNQDIEGGIVLKSFTPSINTTLNGSSVVITNTNLNTSTLTASYFQFTDIVTGGTVRLKPNTTIPSFYNLTLPNKNGTVATEEYADAKISQTINNGITTSAPSEDAVFDALATKQSTLVSGTNIKTIENQSLVGAGNIDLNKSDVGLSNVDNTNDLSKPISTATQAALNTKINTSIIGQPNGLATLDNGGKVLLSQLPNSILVLRGEWNASTNTPTLINGIGTPGYFYKVTTPGTQNLGSGNITFNTGDYAVYGDNGLWFKSINSNSVDSVAGKTGIVVLNKTDVGLSNVDNTSDLNKPVSTATQTALNLKANLSGGNTFNGSQSLNGNIGFVGDWALNFNGVFGFQYSSAYGGLNLMKIGEYDGALFVKNTGDVSINTTNPEEGLKFQVEGNAAIGNKGSARLYGGTLNPTTSFLQSRDLNVSHNLQIFNKALLIGNNPINSTGEMLQVDGSANISGGLKLGSTYTLEWGGSVSNGNPSISGSKSGGMSFYSDSNTAITERLRLLPNGNFGIGTGSPSEKLEVVGGAKIISDSSGSTLKLARGSFGALLGNSSSEDGMLLYNLPGTVIYQRWWGNGNVSVGGGLSDTGEKLQVSGTAKFTGAVTVEGGSVLTTNNLTNTISPSNFNPITSKGVYDGMVTKPTLGGDSLGASLTLGTNDAQDFNLEYNNIGKVRINTNVLIQALAVFTSDVYMTATNSLRTSTGTGGSLVLGDQNNPMKFVHTTSGASTALTGFDFQASLNTPDIIRWRVGGTIAGVRNDARVYGSNAVASNDLVPLGQMNTALALKPTIGYTAPSSANDIGVKGEIRITSTYVYYCIDTNTWVRSVASTW